MLENKRYLFDDITSSLLKGNRDPNECINELADVLYDISFQLKGKRLYIKLVYYQKILLEKYHHGLITLVEFKRM